MARTQRFRRLAPPSPHRGFRIGRLHVRRPSTWGGWIGVSIGTVLSAAALATAVGAAVSPSPEQPGVAPGVTQQDVDSYRAFYLNCGANIASAQTYLAGPGGGVDFQDALNQWVTSRGYGDVAEFIVQLRAGSPSIPTFPGARAEALGKALLAEAGDTGLAEREVGYMLFLCGNQEAIRIEVQKDPKVALELQPEKLLNIYKNVLSAAAEQAGVSKLDAPRFAEAFVQARAGGVSGLPPGYLSDAQAAGISERLRSRKLLQDPRFSAINFAVANYARNLAVRDFRRAAQDKPAAALEFKFDLVSWLPPAATSTVNPRIRLVS